MALIDLWWDNGIQNDCYNGKPTSFFPILKVFFFFFNIQIQESDFPESNPEMKVGKMATSPVKWFTGDDNCVSISLSQICLGGNCHD